VTTQDDDGLGNFIGQYMAKMSQMDADGLCADWIDDETVFYIAEEFDAPIVGRSEIHRYWRENNNIMHRLSVRYGEIRRRPLGGDLTSVMYPVHWNAVVGSAGAIPIGGDIKVMAVVRKTADGWRFCQWAECILGALPFVRRAYQRAADPDFVASMRSA
jgi:ketosteroid isomerase-like protein